MVYVRADGSVGKRERSRNPFRLLSNLIFGVLDVVSLFIRTLTTPPERLADVSGEAVSTERSRLKMTDSGWEKRLFGVPGRGLSYVALHWVIRERVDKGVPLVLMHRYGIGTNPGASCGTEC